MQQRPLPSISLGVSAFACFRYQMSHAKESCQDFVSVCKLDASGEHF